jgi:hypothetical protein
MSEFPITLLNIYFNIILAMVVGLTIDRVSAHLFGSYPRMFRVFMQYNLTIFSVFGFYYFLGRKKVNSSIFLLTVLLDVQTRFTNDLTIFGLK